MGMTLSIRINPKHIRVPYHILELEDKRRFDKTYKEPENAEIFYIERNWDLLYFFRDLAHLIFDDKDEAQVCLYIDTDNIEIILENIKGKIDVILGSSDLYNSDTYGDGTDLYIWSRVYVAIKTFQDKYNMSEWYLLIDAGW